MSELPNGLPALSAEASDVDLLTWMGTDASEWAKVFCMMFGQDEELMLCWFANAIEAGRTAGYNSGVDALTAVMVGGDPGEMRPQAP